MKSIRNMITAIAVITVTLTGCSGLDPNNPDGSQYDFDAGNCTPVIAAVSPEKVNMFTELATLFENSPEAAKLDTCAKVFAVDVSSGEATRLLNTGWSIEDTIKPQPVLWSPASTSWVDQVAATQGQSLVLNPQSFARTPVVFAMPEVMARTMGWPDEPISITDLHDLCLDPEGWGRYGGASALWGQFRLGKTNPNTSTTGLNTLLMQSFQASGKTEGLNEADVAASEAFSREFESCVIHYGDTTGNVLNRVYNRDLEGKPLDYVSAIAVEETSVINYNLGNPTSRVVPEGEVLTPPNEKLVAIYPEGGSLVSDNPIVTLGGPKAPWVSAEQKTAGEAFAAFVLTDTAQDVLDDFGFRKLDPAAPLSGLFTTNNGVDPTLPAVYLEKPSVDVITSAVRQWELIRKPSSVLELIDVSGSMGNAVEGSSSNRMQLAIQGAQVTLKHFRPTDELGVWAFTTGVQSSVGQNVVELREVAPLSGDRENLESELGKLTPTQGTPLYDAILTAYRYMTERAEPGRINAIIVLSDGEDTDSQTSLDALIRELNKNTEGGNESLVRIFPIVYGQDAPPDALTAIAEASGGQVFNASDPRRINLVFQSVVNNF
jgi:Ca-activated chloride channel homolog